MGGASNQVWVAARLISLAHLRVCTMGRTCRYAIGITRKSLTPAVTLPLFFFLVPGIRNATLALTDELRLVEAWKRPVLVVGWVFFLIFVRRSGTTHVLRAHT